jgi:hypothetical protein
MKATITLRIVLLVKLVRGFSETIVVWRLNLLELFILCSYFLSILLLLVALIVVSKNRYNILGKSLLNSKEL